MTAARVPEPAVPQSRPALRGQQDTVEVVLRGGHADGQVLRCGLPLPYTIMTVQPPPLWPPRDPDVSGLFDDQVAYDFTGHAKISRAGEILKALYQVRRA